MDVSLFDYELPRELIAQEAVSPRDAARLMVLEPGERRPAHRSVRDLPRLLKPGDLLVVNDTRVLPARLDARKTTGGRVELVLLEPEDKSEARGGGVWRALVGASRAPKEDDVLSLPGGWSARVVAAPGAGGVGRVELDGPGSLDGLMERHGRLPLPPYITRSKDDPRHARDRERYQSIFARRPGALAAPTASLHFTERLLKRLGERDVALARLTLHVGEGTFHTPPESDTESIRLHPERFALDAQTAGAVARCRERGGRVVAVGTTVARALESRPPGPQGAPQPGRGSTDLFIRPGHRFRYLDGLLTNFHLPRTTLLMLVAAFAGRERVLEAYAEAIAQRYRFFSYGDAMLVLR